MSQDGGMNVRSLFLGSVGTAATVVGGLAYLWGALREYRDMQRLWGLYGGILLAAGGLAMIAIYLARSDRRPQR